MKKVLCIIILFFILIGTSGCSLTKSKNRIIIDKEKIGIEYTVIESNKPNSYDSHGYVKNYDSNFKDNVWTTKFDFMSSTGNIKLKINPKDTLKINSNIDSGKVWIKITQGSLLESNIQKIEAKNGEEFIADLSQWKSGEIEVWLVVKKGKNGVIKIEHIKNN